MITTSPWKQFLIQVVMRNVVSSEIQLCHERWSFRRKYFEMQVGGPIETSAKIDGIKPWYDGFKPILTLFVGDSFPPILEMFVMSAVNDFSGFGMRKAVGPFVPFMVVSP